MSNTARRSPARLLAPIALLVFAFALFTVISDSDVTGGESRGGEEGAASPSGATVGEQDAAPPPRRRPATYTIKVGDSLGLIAEKTGVDTERLEELNPEVDAQALEPGQKLKLRE